jgi:ankyrin repeat protein
MCLRRLCVTNDNSTATDQFWYRKHARTLIDNDSYIYAMRDYDSIYPFLLAVQSGDKILVEAILKNAKSYVQLDIIEPLISACAKSYYDIVQILVDFGFNPNTIMISQDNIKLKNRKMF